MTLLLPPALFVYSALNRYVDGVNFSQMLIITALILLAAAWPAARAAGQAPRRALASGRRLGSRGRLNLSRLMHERAGARPLPDEALGDCHRRFRSTPLAPVL